MLGGIGGRSRRGRQRMRWLDGITDSTDVSLWNLGVFSGRYTGESLPLRVDFIHRVEFEEVSGHRVLIKRGQFCRNAPRSRAAGARGGGGGGGAEGGARRRRSRGLATGSSQWERESGAACARRPRQGPGGSRGILALRSRIGTRKGSLNGCASRAGSPWRRRGGRKTEK